MKTRAITIIVILLPLVVFLGCASHSRPIAPVKAPQEMFTVSPPEQYDVYDSENVKFATVTLILPSQLLGNALHGKWRGKLVPSYHRPKSEITLASDKLNVSGWHDLTFSRDLSEPSYAKIRLYPDMPDDEFELSLPISGETVRGGWEYYTDGGGVDHGTFIGPVHKLDNWLEPQLPIVIVSGGFHDPGLYLWTNGITAADVIRKAGDFTMSSFSSLSIIHLNGSRDQYQLKSADHDTNNISWIIPSIALRPGDQIQSLR